MQHVATYMMNPTVKQVFIAVHVHKWKCSAHFCRNTSAEVLWKTPSRSFTELSAPPPMASAVALLLPAAAGAPAAAGQHKRRLSAAVCCPVQHYVCVPFDQSRWTLLLPTLWHLPAHTAHWDVHAGISIAARDCGDSSV